MKIPSFQYEILSKSFLSLESWLCIIHNVNSFQFTLSVPRWGKFLRQHFSTSFQNPPWKTFCWTVSGMFSQHKDKSRCWMTSWEPAIDSSIVWAWFVCRKYFDRYISGQKSLLQRQMDFLEMFWRIREVVIGTRDCKMTHKKIQISNKLFPEFYPPKRKILVYTNTYKRLK